MSEAFTVVSVSMYACCWNLSTRKSLWHGLCASISELLVWMFTQLQKPPFPPTHLSDVENRGSCLTIPVTNNPTFTSCSDLPVVQQWESNLSSSFFSLITQQFLALFRQERLFYFPCFPVFKGKHMSPLLYDLWRLTFHSAFECGLLQQCFCLPMWSDNTLNKLGLF